MSNRGPAQHAAIGAPLEDKEADPVGGGHADAANAATHPLEPGLPNPAPDVPVMPPLGDDVPGNDDEHPGERPARDPARPDGG